MKAGKQETQKFDSVLVHFNEDKVKFSPDQFKVSHPMVTVPSAWPFKRLKEIGVDMEVPISRKSSQEIKCRGIVVDCRPLKKKKGHYHVDVLLTDVPKQATACLAVNKRRV
ncbi:MAG: hypothetical protein PHV34_17755 [Verrucomicrobiae bacterium]|nr:hypothetical protein [Verrucomicrobiae bacterium]